MYAIGVIREFGWLPAMDHSQTSSELTSVDKPPQAQLSSPCVGFLG